MHVKTRNGRRYYYRSRWVDGQCVKEYFGTGKRGERAARQDADARAQRQEAEHQWRCMWSQVEIAQQPTEALCDRTDLLVKCALILTGHHLHKGHQWRRRKIIHD